jgi:hypothetical protein
MAGRRHPHERDGHVRDAGAGARQGNRINHSDLRKKRSRADFEIAQEKPSRLKCPVWSL